MPTAAARLVEPPISALERRAAALSEIYAPLSAEARLRRAFREDFPGGVALVSSFGADAAVLLHLLSWVEPTAPVLFADTKLLFPETLAYQTDLAERFGLWNVRRLSAEPEAIDAADPTGALHRLDPDACCDLRKTQPLTRALAPFEAWITGRKRHQNATRRGLDVVEAVDGKLKLNPLADWTPQDLAEHRRRYDLPPHPLVARGYPSIGCAPCTSPVAPGEDPRAGRWRGRAKTECGIHLVGGRPSRQPSS